MKLNWNTYHIRPSRHDTVGGVPDVLFQLPELSGAFDCSVTVAKEKIAEMENNCEYETEENLFQEYFHYHGYGRRGTSLPIQPQRSITFTSFSRQCFLIKHN